MSTLAPYMITDASVVRYGVVKLRFADGLSGEVEIIQRMWGPAFERARTEEGFVQMYLDVESGTIAWPGDVDLAPDTLYERVRTGSWPEPARAI
jgi:hypothetical protein